MMFSEMFFIFSCGGGWRQASAIVLFVQSVYFSGWVFFFYANGFFSYAHSGVGVLLGYGFLFLCL